VFFQKRMQPLSTYALGRSPAETRVLEVLQDIDAHQRHLSVPEEDGRLLRVLTGAVNAQHVVELGTSTGYSGLWILLALMQTGGRLTTFEADGERHETARRNFEHAGVLHLAMLIVGDAHALVDRITTPIDLLFIDADKSGYPDYLEKFGSKVRAGGLIVAHNMHQPPPDPRYIEKVTTDPAFETVFLNMEHAGIGVTLKKR
jgi:predicted O-methyltransferase YrrM